MDAIAAPEMSNMSYYITEDQFRLTPNPIPYDGKGPINRDNFTSILIESFAVSEADSDRHAFYFEWRKAQTGFDYRITLQSFIQAGGWNCLSVAEQNTFKTAFRHIQKHHNDSGGKLMRDFADNPALHLEGQLESLTNDFDELQEDIADFLTTYGPIGSLTKTELLKKIAQWQEKQKD